MLVVFVPDEFLGSAQGFNIGCLDCHAVLLVVELCLVCLSGGCCGGLILVGCCFVIQSFGCTGMFIISWFS